MEGEPKKRDRLGGFFVEKGNTFLNIEEMPRKAGRKFEKM